MIVPIKFRGRVPDDDIVNGKMVFGYFVRGGNKKPYILVDNPNNKGQSLYQVDEDSVAQLVGYDAHGAELYEGDTLINENGDEFCAALVPAVITDEGFQHDDIPIEIFTLKKDSAP